MWCAKNGPADLPLLPLHTDDIFDMKFGNDAIMEAIKKSDLKIFLVDPVGDKILDKRDPRAMIPDRPGPLLDTIPPRLIGISQRPISSTFKDDTVEHAKLSRFFA
jgi:hypothetical protein